MREGLKWDMNLLEIVLRFLNHNDLPEQIDIINERRHVE